MTITPNHVKERLKAGKLALGIGLRQARTVDIAKIAKASGYDWLFVDLEHNSMDLDMAAQICVAALDCGITPLVRVPGHQHFHAARILDNGAMGIVIPHVETADETRQAVDNCKFPPLGHRSMGGTLPQISFAKYSNAEQYEIVNEQVMLVMLIESPKAIDNIDAIAAVEGVDALLIGSNDLSTEMGIPGEFGHARIEQAYAATIAAAQKHGKIAGLGGIYDETLVEKFVGMGVRMILGGSDISFLMAAASARSTFLRGLEN